MDTIMFAYSRSEAAMVCVAYANREGFSHQIGYFILRCPAERRHLWIDRKNAAYNATPKYQGNNASAHIFIDTSQGYRFDIEACLFLNFATQAIGNSLIQL
jgi:hypothetical protein